MGGKKKGDARSITHNRSQKKKGKGNKNTKKHNQIMEILKKHTPRKKRWKKDHRVCERMLSVIKRVVHLTVATRSRGRGRGRSRSGSRT